jgi:hypothetical protein
MAFDELLFLIVIQLIMQLIPIQGFANSGNHEGGWTAAMMLIGYPADVSLQFALASHVIIFSFVCALGLSSLLLRFIYFK